MADPSLTPVEMSAIVTAAGGLLVSLVVTVLGFFLKRAVSSNDSAINGLQSELKDLTNTYQSQRTTDIVSYQSKLDELRKLYEERLARTQERIGDRLDKHAEQVSRNRLDSISDVDAGKGDIRRELMGLREKVEELLREHLEFKGHIKGTYVSKEDFIRESTKLEGRIVATKRTLETIDEVLKEFMKE